MRLTINLDDDLYAMARSHAIATKTSLSKAVGDLLRRKLAASPPEMKPDAASYFDPVLGIQVSRSDRPLTDDALRKALDDEDRRHEEAAGWTSGGKAVP